MDAPLFTSDDMVSHWLEHLQRVAMQASPGPYVACGCGRCGLLFDGTEEANIATVHDRWGDSFGVGEENFIEYGRVGQRQQQANLHFFAALSPETILRLVNLARRGLRFPHNSVRPDADLAIARRLAWTTGKLLADERDKAIEKELRNSGSTEDA